MKNCDQCGVQLEENAKFCSACGNPVKKSEPPQETRSYEDCGSQHRDKNSVFTGWKIPAAPGSDLAKPLCPKCGEPREEGARFCTKCGEPCQTVKQDVKQKPKPRFCDRCGSMAGNADNFCPNCGKSFLAGAQLPREDMSGIKYTARENYNGKDQARNTSGYFTGLIVLAFVIILDVLLVPFVSAMDGLIPDFNSNWGTITFADILERIGDYGAEAIGHTDVALVMAALIPAIFVMFGAAAKSKGVCAAFSLIASGLLALLLFIIIDECGSEFVFGEYCSISIGFWIAWLSHIACSICALSIPSRK